MHSVECVWNSWNLLNLYENISPCCYVSVGVSIVPLITLIRSLSTIKDFPTHSSTHLQHFRLSIPVHHLTIFPLRKALVRFYITNLNTKTFCIICKFYRIVKAVKCPGQKLHFDPLTNITNIF